MTTFRKSGRPVSTPVAFAVESGKLYVGTRARSGKFKRIRGNSKVQLAPCTMRGKVVGSTIKAEARILPASEEVLAVRVLESNLGLMMRIGRFLSNLGWGTRGKCLSGDCTSGRGKIIKLSLSYALAYLFDEVSKVYRRQHPCLRA